MPYLGNTDADRKLMLKTVGVAAVEELFADIPEAVRFPALSLPPAQTEMEVLADVERLASENVTGLSFAGAGAYHHFIPSIVSYLSGRGEFATAYTPYQAEASQGTLQSIFEYQSMVAALLDMDIVNASHYDGATAVAEAALMAVRANRGRDNVVISGGLHPEHVQVSRTYLAPQAVPFEVIGSPDAPGSFGPSPEEILAAVDDGTAAVVVANPDFFGRVSDLSALAEEVHARGALLIVHVDPIATALFRSPGSMGADIVTGEGQPLGIPVSFGGPYLGLFAARSELVRKLPGRLVGQTTDADGTRGFVLTLNTREQHIRREKATSNICTNQGLMALRAAIYLAAMGPDGLREAAELCFHNAHHAASELSGLPGCSVSKGTFFKEFVLTVPESAEKLCARAANKGVIPGVPLSRYFPERANELLVAVTETATRSSIEKLVGAVASSPETAA